MKSKRQTKKPTKKGTRKQNKSKKSAKPTKKATNKSKKPSKKGNHKIKKQTRKPIKKHTREIKTKRPETLPPKNPTDVSTRPVHDNDPQPEKTPTVQERSPQQSPKHSSNGSPMDSGSGGVSPKRSSSGSGSPNGRNKGDGNKEPSGPGGDNSNSEPQNSDDQKDSNNDVKDAGQKAAKWALSKVGGCYSQARRDGNPCYDCSSLVYYAWKAAGKNIGATNTRMYPGNTHRIKASDLQPGDILWRYEHAGIYIGNNQFVNAENEANGIRKRTFNAGAWTAFYRPN